MSDETSRMRRAAADAQLRRAERLTALGTMAAGFGHELRNPLNAAHLQLEVAQRSLARIPDPDVDSAREAVGLAQLELKRLAVFVSDCLQFARPQALQLTVCDLRAASQTVIESLQGDAQRAGVSLQLESGPMVEIEADAERLKEALYHLIHNAIDASPAGEVVRVRVELLGETAHLVVRDAGRGIKPGAPVFEPFYTTKQQGTGLGLAVVHRTVLDHGGSVTFESVPGRTEIAIQLPRQSGV